jgi:hypothetical protein
LEPESSHLPRNISRKEPPQHSSPVSFAVDERAEYLKPKYLAHLVG